MPDLQINPSERRALRALAHHLQPVVMVGAAGLTKAVEQEVERCLRVHELIKVRVMSDEADFRREVMTRLCDKLGCAPVQSIGKLLVLFRPFDATLGAASMTSAPATTATRKTSANAAYVPKAAHQNTTAAAPRRVKVVVPATSPTHRPKVKRLTLLGNQRLTQAGQVKRAKKRMTSTKKGR